METRRVLIVEDDPDAVRMAVSLLRDHPIRLLWATNAEDGFELARMHQPDAVLVSWTLPDMSGDELADCLALHPLTARIPIILSGLEPWLFSPQNRERAAQVINKTYLQDELVPRVLDVLGVPSSPVTDPQHLARIRDRSLWWEGEEEEDWRVEKRKLAMSLAGW